MKIKSRGKSPFEKWTLDIWTDKMWHLYGHHDVKRKFPLMWLSVVEYASNIAENVRRDSYVELLDNLVGAFAWIASFVAKLNFDKGIHPKFILEDTMADIIAFKFPDVCGFCLQPKCICQLFIEEVDKPRKKAKYIELLNLRTKFKRTNSSYKIKTVDSWTDMFDRIYKGNIRGAALEQITFHFMEEVGEVANAIRRIEELWISERVAKNVDSIEAAVDIYKESKTKTKTFILADLKLSLATEIADSFSWWTALYFKMVHVFNGTKSNLLKSPKPNKLFRRKYHTKDKKLVCHECGKTHCECPVFGYSKN